MSEWAAKITAKVAHEGSGNRQRPGAETSNAGNLQAILALQRAAGNRAVADLLRRSSGHPLEPKVREEMETKFGEDFRDVRVHTDSAAHAAASLASARAMTLDRHITFNRNVYAPDSSKGKRLLAHELTHVVQQRANKKGASVGSAESEAEAKTASESVESGTAPTVRTSSTNAPQLEPMSEEEQKRQDMANMLPPGLRADVQKWTTPPATVDISKLPLLTPPGINRFFVQGPTPVGSPKGGAAPSPSAGVTTQEGQTKIQRIPNTGKSAIDAGSAIPTNQTPLFTVNGRPYVKDPEPTEFEKQIQAGKTFQIKIHPKPDIDPRSVRWVGGRPSDEKLKRSQFSSRDNPSARIWMDEGKEVDVNVKPDNVMPIRDFKTNKLLGYRYRQGDSMIILDRNGEIRGDRNLEQPLEHPAIDPIDVAMLAADVGPIAAKGLVAGGKAIAKAVTKAGTRDIGEFGAEEGTKLLAREATDALESQGSHAGELGELGSDVKLPTSEPLDVPAFKPAEHPVIDQPSIKMPVTDPAPVPASLSAPVPQPPSAPTITKQAEELFHRKAELSAQSLIKAQSGKEVIDPNLILKKSFAGIDLISEAEITSVKAYGGPTRFTRYKKDLVKLSGGDAQGIGAQSYKAAGDIAKLESQMKAAGKPLALPKEYEADPVAYIEKNTVFRIPDNDVEDLRNMIVKDLTDPNHPYGYQDYGLEKALTPEEARDFAVRRIKGVGKNLDDLSPKQ